MSDILLIDLHDGVQTLTLNRPERLNALSGQLLLELSEAFKAAGRDDAVKAVVVTGQGRAFSSGADVAEFRDLRDGQEWQPPDLGAKLRNDVNPLIRRITSLEKPVFAAVNGIAAGAGMSLSLACDVRYAAESARFIQVFVNIGLVPDGGSFYFLPRLVGMSKAMELAWTAEPVSAQEALSLGLVNRVLPDAELLARIQEAAAKVARGPSTAIALVKRGMSQAHELSLDRVLEMEAQYQGIASQTRDFDEGVGAFLEKRPAQFTGR